VTPGGDLTIFYVADIHGSDVCFRKWLNAGRFYGADVLVIGGDLTGKVLLPIVPGPGGQGWMATWKDRQHRLETRQDMDDLVRAVRDEGTYAFITTPDEVAEIRASADRERETFTRLRLAAMEDWLRLADERLADGGIRAFVMAGNDDPPELDGLLATSRTLVDVQGQVTELAPGIAMASRGESTPTPWRTPRELPEDELAGRVREAVTGLPDRGITIWNLHMPPRATGIDEAPVLDASLRVQYDGSGDPRMAPVGSAALRTLIEERQPAIALHGHIHEGRGRYRLGRTVGFNPGSRYQDGVLTGVLLRVSARNGLRDAVFTAG